MKPQNLNKRLTTFCKNLGLGNPAVYVIADAMNQEWILTVEFSYRGEVHVANCAMPNSEFQKCHYYTEVQALVDHQCETIEKMLQHDFGQVEKRV